MVLYITTWYDAEENETVYVCCRRSGRVWRCISLLETVGVDYRTVDLYWGRSIIVWCCRSLLGTVW